MEIDFEEAGWNSWLILPTAYDAGLCWGQCNFPLGQEYSPTNHAVVQSVWNRLHPQAAPPPCCVAHELDSLTMLYHKGQYVVLKKVPDMIVRTCRCF